MLYFSLRIPMGISIFITENQGNEGGRTATYDRLETGAVETGNPLSVSHKLR